MISTLSLTEPDKWDSIIKSFDRYDVYYLSQYVKAFKIHGDGEPCLFYFQTSGFRAANVVIKRDIASHENFKGRLSKGSHYDLVTPYGYGGFITDGDDSIGNIELLDNEYGAFCRDTGIVSEFVRFHPVLQNHSKLGTIYDITTLGRTVTVNLQSLDQIWADLSSKNRNVIRKAAKSGVSVYWGRNPELFQKFIELYTSTMDRDNATDYYYFGKDFYESILMDLKYNATIFYAMYDQEIIAMAIILHANKQLHYHLSASDANYRHLAATNLLLCEAAYWGCENGYKTFHLGGGLGSKEDSLFKFKKAFNKDSNTSFAIGKKIFDRQRYDKLVQYRKLDQNFTIESSFFPLYRAQV